MKKILVLLFVTVISQLVFSQKPTVDSLLAKLATLKDTDTSKAIILNDLALKFYNTNADTTLMFAQQALDISLKTNFVREVARSYKVLGIGYYVKTDYNTALKNYLKALEISEKIKDKKNMISLDNNIGLIYWRLDDNQRALKYFKDALKLLETTKDNERTASVLLKIGTIYDKLDSMSTAVRFYKSALKIRQDMKDTLGIASSANNIAFVLYKQKKYDQALPYFEQARVLFGYKKDFYNSTIININIGNLYSDINKPEKATPYFAEAQIMAQKSVSPEMKLEVYNAFYKFHKKYNRISEALDNYEKFIKLQDSIFSEKRKTEFAELETKYETEKKEQENALLRAKDEKNIAVIKQQRNLTWFILTALVLIAAFAVFVLRTAKIRKQMNTMLVHKNTEINQQKEEIQTQNDMLLSQKEEIMAYAENMEKANFHISNQNEKLERINHNIKSSINYASKIQNAMLPENSRFSQFFADHFIVFKPRDIVSGDFYYVKEVNDYIIFAVGDCTGHGVPGAFVSMLAISLLNELILRREINQAAQLLDVMRDEIKKSLNQKGEQGETKDGLDIALCVINKSSLQLQYAGAHNSAYVFRQSDGGFENFEFKPDKQPIGINRLELPFTNTDFQAQKGDRIYLFSDGFLDQFNDKSEKYKISRFRNFLTHIQAKPFTEHKSIFDQEFESWKGSTEQIDDVTVIGLVI